MCDADEQHWIEASRDGDNVGGLGSNGRCSCTTRGWGAGGAAGGMKRRKMRRGQVIIGQLPKGKLAASTVLDQAGFCPRCGAPAPQIHGWGAGGGAGGAGNDASCGIGGKAGAGSLRPLDGVSFR
jgi:hypothetical protein